MTTPTSNPRYQPFYCEENIYQLCADGGFADGDASVVFISNAGRTCALWAQRAAREQGAPVVWDYHVVLVDASGPQAMVWDLDTLVGAPVPFAVWWQATFPFGATVPEPFQPQFRVVPAGVFLQTFSSDRSHMRDAQGHWQAPPPEWAPIFRPDEGMNLDRFIDMDSDFVGEVLDAAAMRRRFGSQE
ncbi:hypothetical protein FIV42_01540 [Persicimonas caeni]|uniref:Protein N-terminal glutamine amidohydrolase n=1 Tax=Persicimonas caeni TaxID=2292766 RepID=A0A4Y6PMC7_PERCE|nr:protein N-terminal glutamine amidohydrolase [Persicimonas caeni]QDG49466.1 hypothetical protein FIV42_01540 [Persicimonas caeni]QED30687.1 hypothetical protein FRD00_01535 [Persicimonas caeni]